MSSGRSVLELRRLAYKAKYTPGVREVLHDALLETFPAEYGAAIQRAESEARRSKKSVEKAVIFLPDRMRRLPMRGRGKFYPKVSPDLLFDVMNNTTLGGEDTTTKALEAEFYRLMTPSEGIRPSSWGFDTIIIVYRTRGEL